MKGQLNRHKTGAQRAKPTDILPATDGRIVAADFDSLQRGSADKQCVTETCTETLEGKVIILQMASRLEQVHMMFE